MLAAGADYLVTPLSYIKYTIQEDIMTKIDYEIDINAPLDAVYKYYTDLHNIQEAWPQDIVKESKFLSEP